MKQLLTIVFALYACLAYTQNAPDAASLLSGIEGRIKSYGDFRVHLDIDGSNSTLTVSSDKFHLESADAEVWYDGTTLWSCMMQSGEVYVTAPTAEELMYINPYALLKEWNRNFKATLGSKAAGYGKVTLTPRQSAEYESLDLYVDSAGDIRSLTVIYGGGDNSVITIKKLEKKVKTDSNMFIFDQNKYPDFNIVDLR